MGSIRNLVGGTFTELMSRIAPQQMWVAKFSVCGLYLVFFFWFWYGLVGSFLTFCFQRFCTFKQSFLQNNNDKDTK